MSLYGWCREIGSHMNRAKENHCLCFDCILCLFATVNKKLVEVDDRSAPLHTTLYALDEVLERKVRQCCMKPTFQLVTYCALVVHAAHTVIR